MQNSNLMQLNKDTFTVMFLIFLKFVLGILESPYGIQKCLHSYNIMWGGKSQVSDLEKQYNKSNIYFTRYF